MGGCSNPSSDGPSVVKRGHAKGHCKRYKKGLVPKTALSYQVLYDRGAVRKFG